MTAQMPVVNEPDTTSPAVPGAVTPFAVAKTALRYALEGIEDVLAHMASGGSMSYERLCELGVQSTSASVSRRDLAGLKTAGVSALAYWLAATATRRDPADQVGQLRMAGHLFGLARRVAKVQRTFAPHANVAVQVALLSGQIASDDHGLIDELAPDPSVAWAARADLKHPFDAPTPDALDAWLAVFNEPVVAAGLDPIRIADATKPFESLTTSASVPAGSVDGPLVSVIMPVYATGSDDLMVSVRSLLAQTWSNLQIIVVDDASPAQHRAIFDEVAALDERIEVLRKPVNGGAYAARNAGLGHARGQFVAVQDADDWSHPQRIERQVAPLLDDADLLATLSQAIYVHRDLRITKVAALPIGRHLPSLVMRREKALETLGYFDSVRKAADGEYVERIVSVFGPGALHTIAAPLSLYQLTSNSLSRDDFTVGWHRHTRVSYRSAYRHWHHQIAAGRAHPMLSVGEPRTFPAPRLFEAQSTAATFDVVVVADTRPGVLALRSLVPQITALAEAGLRVAIARSEPLEVASADRVYPAEPIARLIASGAAAWTALDDEVSTHTLLVTDARLMQYPRVPGHVALRTSNVVIIGRQRDERAESVVKTTFGCEPAWVFADVIDLPHTGMAPMAGRPVIAVDLSSSHRAECATLRTLDAILPTDAHHDVRIWSDPSATSGLHPSWLALPARDITLAQFAVQCDFVVGVPSPANPDVALRPLFDLMAYGCVPVVPDALHSLFGDVALYYGERSVASVVDELWAEPALMHRRRQVVRNFVHARLSAQHLTRSVAPAAPIDPGTSDADHDKESA